MLFAPSGQSAGAWSYAYSFADLGETHDASGTYSIGARAADGMRTLTIAGGDHVVFKGFDGRMPMNYVFGLKPAGLACPN
jgi:hypothetical protein